MAPKKKKKTTKKTEDHSKTNERPVKRSEAKDKTSSDAKRSASPTKESKSRARSRSRSPPPPPPPESKRWVVLEQHRAKCQDHLVHSTAYGPYSEEVANAKASEVKRELVNAYLSQLPGEEQQVWKGAHPDLLKPGDGCALKLPLSEADLDLAYRHLTDAAVETLKFESE